MIDQQAISSGRGFLGNRRDFPVFEHETTMARAVFVQRDRSFERPKEIDQLYILVWG